MYCGRAYLLLRTGMGLPPISRFPKLERIQANHAKAAKACAPLRGTGIQYYSLQSTECIAYFRTGLDLPKYSALQDMYLGLLTYLILEPSSWM